MPDIQEIERDPIGGNKVPRSGKRARDGEGGPPTAGEAAESETQTQGRESEQAFDRALGRLPPG